MESVTINKNKQMCNSNPASHPFLHRVKKVLQGNLLKQYKSQTSKENSALKAAKVSDIISPACPLDVFSDLKILCSSSMADCKLMTASKAGCSTTDRVVLKIALLNTVENKKAIESEAWIMSKCQHPNIIRMNSCYTFRNSLWIEMEYCPRGKLTSLFELGLPFSEVQIASLCKELLLGLEYLHDRMIIHNDMKSDNVLLGHDYSIKISDLGLSKQLKSKQQTRRTSLGTTYWMAPEQIGKNANYGLPADIWSFGIIVLEMINNGIPPHFDLRPEIALVRIMALPAPRINSSYSPAFQDFMSHVLVKDPTQRYSAKQLLQHPFIKKQPVQHPSKFIPQLIDQAKQNR